ncbi:MAG: tetratricopeptide repeat protein [Candidatus Aceula meridiana]|nr:tetratricopeptide repeat protein [Candidatus Aceula meridiana]
MKLISKDSNLTVFLILGIVVFAIFGNAFFNNFAYDDHYLILENEYIHDFSHLKEIFFSDVTQATPLQKASGYYRPVAMVYLVGLYSLLGLNSFALHLSNVLLHLLNSFLVFLLVDAITKKRRVAFLSSLIFAVHPIHVEAVAPIFNYMGILASMFSLASFLMFVKSDGLKKKHYATGAVILFFLALFSKEEAIVLPVVYMLYDFFFVFRFSFKDFCRSSSRYLWFLLVAVLYLFARSQLIEKPAAFGFWDLNLNMNVAAEPNLFLHLVSVICIFAKYLGLFVVPIKLTAFYLLPTVAAIGGVTIFISIFVVFGLLSCAIFFAKKIPVVSFFIWFFFLSSFLISNIIPIGGLFAERFMYFPSVAYCVLFAIAFFYFFDKLRSPRMRSARFLLQIVLGIVIVLYAQKTVTRNYVWRNDVTLWADTKKKTPRSSIVRIFYADALYMYEIFDKAVEQYRIALEYPGVPASRMHNAIGKVYGRRNQYDKAIIEFKKALEANPLGIETHYNLGISYLFKGQTDIALEYFQRGRTIDNNYSWIYYGMGMAYEKKGELAVARPFYQRAFDLNPNHKETVDALERLK